LATNQLVTFDDSDRATCEFDMFAQHRLEESPAGTYYLLRARYTEELIRTPDGWRIRSIITSNRWEEGNLDAVAEAIERVRQTGR
jgi:hypothetical protein